MCKLNKNIHGEKYVSAEVLSPQISTKIGPANRKSAKVSHLRKVRKSNKLFKSANFVDLRFAEVIFGPPTFDEIKEESRGEQSYMKKSFIVLYL